MLSTTGRNIDVAAEMLDGNIWTKGDKIRVYLNTDFKKNQKAWLQFDEILGGGDYENFMDGASLKVFTDCDQSSKWNMNASKKCKHRIMQEIAGILGFKVCDTWEEVIL